MRLLRTVIRSQKYRNGVKVWKIYLLFLFY